jgi:hypothetical protein
MSFRISVQVKTQTRKQNIVKISQQEYQVSVHAAPVAGKANREVVELLARYFSVPKSSVRVLRVELPKKAGRDRLTDGELRSAENQLIGSIKLLKDQKCRKPKPRKY